METPLASSRTDVLVCSSEVDLVTRLRKRAEIRRSITTRKSVQEGKPDRIADLLEEAATAIERLGENMIHTHSLQVFMESIDVIRRSLQDRAETHEEVGDAETTYLADDAVKKLTDARNAISDYVERSGDD